MRIFVRKSKASYIDAAEIFRVLAEGMRFFGLLFNQ